MTRVRFCAVRSCGIVVLTCTNAGGGARLWWAITRADVMMANAIPIDLDAVSANGIPSTIKNVAIDSHLEHGIFWRALYWQPFLVVPKLLVHRQRHVFDVSGSASRVSRRRWSDVRMV